MPKSRTSPEPHIALEPDMTLCAGKITCRRCQRVKRNQQQCRKPANTGSNYCRNHGGALKPMIGASNPSWKGGISTTMHNRPGRWTEILGASYRDSYLKALRDPEILSLEDEIALIDVRLTELIGRCDANADWQDAREQYHALVSAMGSSDTARIRAALQRLGELFDGQHKTDRAWNETILLTERRRSLAESERKRLVELDMYLSREQARNFGLALIQLVTRHVKDRKTLEAIMLDYQTIIAAGKQEPNTLDK